MFWHNFKNCMRVTVKGKITLFWTLLFPILLATFMHAAFRNISKDKMFKNIDVAVVSSGNEENELMYVLELLADGDDSLLNIHKMTEEEAGKALDDEEVKGIIFTDDISLVVKKSSVNASILESILKNYKQNEYALKDIIGNMESAPNEMQINAIMADIMSDVSYYTESSTSSGNQDNITNYFYAIFAMSCLFAGFTAVGEINNLQANISARGMRRCISPNSKIVFILSEFAAMILIQFLAEIIAFIYMNIIGVDFGNKYPAIIITLFFGCMIGLAIGIIVGAISRLKEDAKVGIVISVSMVFSVMADLCVGGIKHLIELHAPIINRINPAALITDCFYSLNVYDDYSVFTQKIVIMAVESVVLTVIAFMMIRRNKYASI